MTFPCHKTPRKFSKNSMTKTTTTMRLRLRLRKLWRNRWRKIEHRSLLSRIVLSSAQPCNGASIIFHGIQRDTVMARRDRRMVLPSILQRDVSMYSTPLIIEMIYTFMCPGQFVRPILARFWKICQRRPRAALV